MGQELQDGNVSFRGGQNAGILPDRIGDDQYVTGINVTTKDGGLGPRPGFVQQPIEVITEGGVTNIDNTVTRYSTIFRTGKFQAAAPYTAESDQRMIVVISGIIFDVNVEKGTAQVMEVEPQKSVETTLESCIEPPTQRLDQYCSRHNWSDAGRYLTIFDYPDYPVLIEGGKARRADPDAVDAFGDPEPEVPNGVLGTFNQSRLFVGSSIHEFTAGDPVGSLAAPNAPITFSEVFVPAAEFLGQVFSLGSTNTNNPITAMGFMQLTDTATGIGPLFVSTKDAVYTYRTDLPRTQWEQTQFGSLMLFNSGFVGARSFSYLNSDLIFMSGDSQVRTLHTARASQGKWANAPIDREVRNWVRVNDEEIMPLTVSASYGNRTLISVDPFRTSARTLDGAETHDYAFGGLIVLELDNISGLLADAAPVWAGLWTGLYVTELVEFNDSIYIWAKDPVGINQLYRIDDSITYDVVEDQVKQVTARIVTKQYDFEHRFLLKEEVTIEPAFKDLEGDVTVRVDRKPESAKNWIKHRVWEYVAKTEECDNVESEDLDELLAQSFREMNFGSPVEEECNPLNGDSYNYFRKTQYRLTINAKNWKLEDVLVRAEAQGDDKLISILCDQKEKKVIKKDCSDVDDWLLYRTPYDIVGDVAAWQ